MVKDMISRFLNFFSTVNGSYILSVNTYAYSIVVPLKWQNGQYIYTNGLSFVRSRDILTDQMSNKYAEKIVFNAANGNSAVVIGYNPASCSSIAIDKSNYLISNLLYSNGYKEYYLFNMFPDVSSQKINKPQSILPNYIDDVLDFLISDSVNGLDDVFIFWGSSVYVSVSTESKLKQLQNQNRKIFTIGTKSVSHNHPGRNVSLNTISYTTANLSSIVPDSRYLK